MNLKELKKMIAEEYSAYTQEVKEQDMPDMPEMPGMPSVNVGPGDIDVAGEENPEETLRAIYDMLKDYFEGENMKDEPEMDEPEMDEPEEEEKEEEEEKVDEGMGMYDEDEKEKKKEKKEGKKMNKKAQNSSMNENLKRKRKALKDRKLQEAIRKIKKQKNSKVLVERFQKLANIKK